MAEDCFCGGLCGECKKAANHHAAQHDLHNTPLPPIDTGTHPKGKRAPSVANPKVADFTRVYVLGDGSKGRVIEQFAGQTGYHIRTIPQGRFNNPVMVASGGGYLVVVDRFGTEDVLRVTDKYAGAGAAGFDDDGFPKDSVDWGNLPDIKQFRVGTFVSGVQVLSRGTLIATVPNGGRTTFYKADLDGAEPLYTGLFTLPAPYDQIGDACGVPCEVNQTNTSSLHEFYATVRNDAHDGALVKVDFLENKVRGLIGLPSGIPFGVAVVDDHISVMMGDATGQITKVYRMVHEDGSNYMVNLYSDTIVPAPENTGITKTFTTLDDPKATPEAYYGVTSALAHNFAPGGLSSREETTADPAVARGGRTLSATTTGAKNDNRTPVQTRYLTGHYQTATPVPVKCQRIDNPSGAGLPAILDLDSINNTVAELLRYTSGGDPDTEKPLFRLVHGKQYDYLSDGGFTYGCVQVGTSTIIPVTSGLSPISMSVDRSTEPGKLKELPDAKAALIDAKTGLLVYADIKPHGFRWYGGTMAGLRLSDEAQHSVKRTGCSAQIDSAVEAYDGIEVLYDPTSGKVTTQQQSIVSPANFSTANDGRGPWALYIPRVTPGRYATSPYDSKPVLAKDPDGAFLPWWPVEQRQPPAEQVGVQNQMFYPKRTSNTPTPIFAVSATSGFFGLNWQKQRVQAGVDGDGHPVVVFQTPDSILNFRFGPMDLTPAYQPATPEAVSPETSGQPAFTVVHGLGQETSLRRGVIFDTNIRSWVGVEVLLERTGVFSDGVADWIQPVAYDNGLGVPVGVSAYNPANEAIICSLDSSNTGGAFPGSAYDSGDHAGDGAFGFWQIDVFANGRPISTLATLVTFPEQIQYLAPAEAVQELETTFNAAGASALGYHKGRVYFSPEVITEVTLRAKLINYALSVYRVGWHTISFAHQDFIAGGPSLCPGKDPGFFAGANCEAACCGNVACSSQVLFGNKLFSTDPTASVVVNTLWEGQATFRIPTSNNPYAAKGYGVGTLINGFLHFDLNGAMSGWAVNLRAGSGR